uniref:Uncharacterized protein n=1 Tax=Magallana gigas TaxID=29159 RepID=A0A8W8MW69_MAGGI
MVTEIGQKACIVYRSRFRPVVGVMYKLKCSKCNTVYKCNTYKRKGLELYYNDTIEQEYFMSTCDSVFSMAFMRRIDIDMSTSGILGFLQSHHTVDSSILMDKAYIRSRNS